MDGPNGKVIIFMGEGYGKSAAALGIALRRASIGQRIVVIQFLKAKDVTDNDFLKRLEPEIKFFRFEKSQQDYRNRTSEEQREAVINIRNGLGFARKVLTTGECDLLILDEVLEVINKGIIEVEDLRSLVELRDDTDVIVTGSAMDEKVCTFADEISEIDPVAFRSYDTDRKIHESM